jgi:tRNA(Leu) C34 or U34 (ribose-2'-O)-methylase TrmL
MGCCNTKIELRMYVFIPSWNNHNNIGSIRRSCCIFNIPLYIGVNGDRNTPRIITAKENKGIERICQGVGSHIVIKNPGYFVNMTPSYVRFVLMETKDFWHSRHINPISIYDIKDSGDIMFVFGNEIEGIDDETIHVFSKIPYTACYLPQSHGLVNTRKRQNNVSLNLAHTVLLSIGIMNGRNKK